MHYSSITFAHLPAYGPVCTTNAPPDRQRTPQWVEMWETRRKVYELDASGLTNRLDLLETVNQCVVDDGNGMARTISEAAAEAAL